ncbi:right-handed parallel beta-helix repeat-containing protein [Pseudoflavitalea rhizosphaerae]|uniref:right-handed parallel beta-helix repeat-containing protein n=1 Tax=Pseudoflavitalea rhizosphaerae TaxID=1884793 RepID=UPI000F8E5F60|nr:right-handed parallel beta-helix repeat-containing protein [Pseudoflavitalea rhizosphaerae]
MEHMRKAAMIAALLFYCLNLLAVDRHVYAPASIQTQIDACVAGDRVLLHAGTYSQAVVIANKNNITLTSAGDGEAVIAGNGSAVHTIYIENSSSVTISGLTIKNIRKQAWSTGITFIGAGNNLTISGNKITEISYVNKSWDPSDNPGSSGVGANGIAIVGDNASSAISNVSILNNEVSYCITGWSEGIALKGNINNFNIEGNNVHHITNIGIDVLGLATYPAITTNNQPSNGTIKGNTAYNCICNYTDNGAIYADGAINVLIANNKVYNSKFGITVGCENQIDKPNATSSGIHVRNNLIYNNSLAGILYGSNGVNNGSAEGTVSYSSITGNTLIKNASSSQWASEIVLQNANNIDCFNNVIYGRYTQMFTVATGVSAINCRANYYYNNTASFSASQQTGAGTWTGLDLTAFRTLTNDNGTDQSIFSDPEITSASETNPDPHLQSGSPCINAGKSGFSPFSGEVDFDGQPRLNGTRVDIGVDETGTQSSCPAITVNGNLNDWSSIAAIATATGQSALTLKVTNNAQLLFFGVAGSGMDNTQYQIYIDSDNNAGTGYQDSQFGSSGADYLIENGLLYRYTGTGGWSWTAVSATVNASKSATVTELSINRSAFTALGATITVAYKDMTNWVTQSKLPSSGSYAAYSLINCQ